MTTIGMGLMIAFISPSFAQDHTNEPKTEKPVLTPTERAQKRTDKMTKQLGLSDDQAKKIYDINLKHATEMESIRAEQEKLRKKAKAQREQSKKEIGDVLTEAQKAKAAELKQKKQDKMNNGEGKGKKKGKGPKPGQGE